MFILRHNRSCRCHGLRTLDFPGHEGRPGQVGGSLPRSAGGAAKQTLSSMDDYQKIIDKYNKLLPAKLPSGKPHPKMRLTGSLASVGSLDVQARHDVRTGAMEVTPFTKDAEEFEFTVAHEFGHEVVPEIHNRAMGNMSVSREAGSDDYVVEHKAEDPKLQAASQMLEKMWDHPVGDYLKEVKSELLKSGDSYYGKKLAWLNQEWAQEVVAETWALNKLGGSRLAKAEKENSPAMELSRKAFGFSKPKTNAARPAFKQNALLRRDPTRTGMIVRRWDREIKRRFGLIKKLIMQSVVEQDCFGLKPVPHTLDAEFEAKHPRGEGGEFVHSGSESDNPEQWDKYITDKKIIDLWHVTDAGNLSGIQKKGFIAKEASSMSDPVDTDRVFFATVREQADSIASQYQQNGAEPAIIHLRVPAHLLVKLDPRIDAGMPESSIAVKPSSKLHKDFFLGVESVSGKGIPQTWKERSSELKVHAATDRDAFRFKRNPDKAKGFMDWLEDQVDRDILTVTYSKTGRKVTGDSRWQQVYVDTSYKAGMRKASNAILREKRGMDTDRFGRKIPAGPIAPVDTAFLAPIHADAMGLIYTRVFTDLKNVTEAMDAQISRDLSMGLANGKGPMEIAREMIDDVDEIGINRARTIARTETIYAHNEAALNTFEEAGIEGVTVEAEWATAGFDVCPDCADLQGRVFTVAEARQVHPPLHPNCRCSMLPAGVGEDAGAEYDEDSIGEQYKRKDGTFKLRGFFRQQADFPKPPRRDRT